MYHPNNPETKAGGDMLLTDVELHQAFSSHLSNWAEAGYDDSWGDDGMAQDNYKVIRRAQLKKVVEELEGQIGMYSRTADDGRVWLPIDKFRQALLSEVKE